MAPATPKPGSGVQVAVREPAEPPEPPAPAVATIPPEPEAPKPGPPESSLAQAVRRRAPPMSRPPTWCAPRRKWGLPTSSARPVEVGGVVPQCRSMGNLRARRVPKPSHAFWPMIGNRRRRRPGQPEPRWDRLGQGRCVANAPRKSNHFGGASRPYRHPHLRETVLRGRAPHAAARLRWPGNQGVGGHRRRHEQLWCTASRGTRRARATTCAKLAPDRFRRKTEGYGKSRHESRQTCDTNRDTREAPVTNRFGRLKAEWPEIHEAAAQPLGSLTRAGSS